MQSTESTFLVGDGASAAGNQYLVELAVEPRSLLRLRHGTPQQPFNAGTSTKELPRVGFHAETSMTFAASVCDRATPDRPSVTCQRAPRAASSSFYCAARVQAQIHLIRPIPTATSTFLSTPVALDARGPHAVLSGVSHGTVDQNVAQVIALPYLCRCSQRLRRLARLATDCHQVLVSADGRLACTVGEVTSCFADKPFVDRGSIRIDRAAHVARPCANVSSCADPCCCMAVRA